MTPWTITVAEEGLSAIAGPVIVAAILTRSDAQAPVYKYKDLRQQPIISGPERYFDVPKSLQPVLIHDLSCRCQNVTMVQFQGSKLVDDLNARSDAYVTVVARLMERERLRKSIGRSYEYTIQYSTQDTVDFDRLSGIQSRSVTPDWRHHAAVALASSRRDHLLALADAEFPEYEFLDHRGYRDPRHLRLIHKFGLSRFHYTSGAQ